MHTDQKLGISWRVKLMSTSCLLVVVIDVILLHTRCPFVTGLT